MLEEVVAIPEQRRLYILLTGHPASKRLKSMPICFQQDLVKNSSGSKGQTTSKHNSDKIGESICKKGSDLDLCCICFDQVCKIEVQDCGHQMCAQCMLALCCHNKTNPTTACLTAQVWPFCKSSIAQLVVANVKTDVDIELGATSVKLRKSRRSRNFSEGSSSFKGLSDAGSFSKIGGRGSWRIAADIECIDKP